MEHLVQGSAIDRAAMKIASRRLIRLVAGFNGATPPGWAHKRRNGRSLRAVLILYSLAVSGLVSAQVAATDPDQLSEVVVTGTRITRTDNVQSPTPVVTVTALDMQNSTPQGAFYSLVNLPQFSGSSGPQGFIGLQSGSAQQSLDLRNLGSQRLLVMLDGRRLAPSDGAGTVDVSLIPTALLQRVEVVTGGASASYGSDAVSGVVNYILDTNFEGFKAEVNGGISTYGDSGSGKVSAAFGTPFASGSGHFIASVDYFYQDPILPDDTKRSWDQGIAQLVNVGGIPNLPVLYTRSGTTTYVPSSGLITGGPLNGTTFNSAGNPVPYNFGTNGDGNNQIGGGGNQNISSLMTRQEDLNLFTHAKFDLSDTTSAFLEAAYSRDRNWDYAQQDFTVGANYLTIANNNAFLTPQTLALMNANNVTSFQLQKLWGDIPDSSATGIEDNFRFAAGINGQFRPGWTWNTYLQFTRSQDIGIQGGALDWQRLYAAVDSVISPTTGKPVCQSTLLYGLNPGCVPINVMGAGNVSQAAYNYVTGLPNSRVADIPEWSTGFLTQAPLFSLWSKPVILAGGIEARELGFHQVGSSDGVGVPDYTGIAGVAPGRIGQPGQFMTGGWATYSGTQKVAEAFAEVDAPIIQDVPGVHDLNANAAVRQTQYNPSGPATTWKAGINYEPIADVRLRATDSYDIHAPTPEDLYNPSSLTTIGTVVDPISGKSLPVEGYTLGNPALNPEKGRTYTFGLVYTPSWARPLSLSIDYWHINISGAIASVGTVQSVLDACELQQSAFACSLITGRGSSLINVNLPIVNNTELATHGVDFDISYNLSLGKGDLALRTVWTYLPYYAQALPSTPAVNIADEYGKWNGTGSATYKIGPFTAATNVRFLDHRTVNVMYTQGVFIDNNEYPSHTYVNLNTAYAFGVSDKGKAEVFLNVQNLTNNTPDFRGIPSYIQIPTLEAFGGAVWEDVIGRYFTLGLRVNFK